MQSFADTTLTDEAEGTYYGLAQYFAAAEPAYRNDPHTLHELKGAIRHFLQAGHGFAKFAIGVSQVGADLGAHNCGAASAAVDVAKGHELDGARASNKAIIALWDVVGE